MDKSIRGQVGLVAVVVGLVLWHSWQYNRVTATVNVTKTTQGIAAITKNSPMTLSAETIATHARPGDCWVIIDGVVYDVTLYLALHPGGNSAISQYCGTDGSQGFANKGGKGLHSAVARAILAQLKVGTMGETISARVAQSARSAIQRAIDNGTIPAGKEDDD
ncbi:cytochrome b5 domain-containing protein [Candidatus Gottesmanbacteria bacterium]|nr:cytochrome b5 domain-containing protein [Candidatus Gottesmanbacteria bacterium]